ncbi:MAG: hypothetical protein IPL53_13345 [Ignavibacteria bacterium]|nr:hypothetical protein [Ignavibacteria bacterium]
MSEDYNPNIKTPEELELGFSANYREEYNDVNSLFDGCSHDESETDNVIREELDANGQPLSNFNRIIITSMELQ